MLLEAEDNNTTEEDILQQKMGLVVIVHNDNEKEIPEAKDHFS